MCHERPLTADTETSLPFPVTVTPLLVSCLLRLIFIQEGSMPSPFITAQICLFIFLYRSLIVVKQVMHNKLHTHNQNLKKHRKHLMFKLWFSQCCHMLIHLLKALFKCPCVLSVKQRGNTTSSFRIRIRKTLSLIAEQWKFVFDVALKCAQNWKKKT